MLTFRRYEKKLYEKRKSFFSKWEASNYIFVVDNFDENIESIEDGDKHLSNYISKEYKVEMMDLLLALFSIKTRRIRIYIGENTKNKLTESKAQEVISSLGDLLRENNYYEAFLKYYDILDSKMGDKLLGIILFIVISIFNIIFYTILFFSGVDAIDVHVVDVYVLHVLHAIKVYAFHVVHVVIYQIIQN